MQRQLADALNDPDNAWGEIYRGLHYRVRKTEFVGARNADDGQRLAGHQLRITVELADDPVKGEELDPQAAFAQFLAALEATSDSTYLTQAATIRSLLSGSNEPWSALQRRHGMTAGEVDALGISPLGGDPQAREAEELTIEVAGRLPVTEVSP